MWAEGGCVVARAEAALGDPRPAGTFLCLGARKGALLAALALAICLGPGRARAQTWNASAGNWSDANCWSGGEPNARYSATVANGGTATITQAGERCYNLTLGSSVGHTGMVNLMGGALESNTDYVGYSSTFTQSDGNNTVNVTLYLGYGGTGTYNLSGGVLTAHNNGGLDFWSEMLGWGASGVFNQTGGVNVLDGVMALAMYSGPGTYTLSGGHLNGDSGAELIGENGTGTFTQSDGNNVVNALRLGDGASASGTYVLSGAGRLMVTGYEWIGGSGTGTFMQSDGNHTVLSGSGGSGLYIAYRGTGTYILNGPGRLTVLGDEFLGYGGKGAFTQSDGNHTVSGALYLGYLGGSSGTYQLSGGRLWAPSEFVGYEPNAVFTQSGGDNTTKNLYVGYYSGSGRYQLSGTGVLTVSSGGSLRVGADTGAGRFEWFGGTLKTPNLSIGSKGTLAMGFNFDVGPLLNGSLYQGGALSLGSVFEITNGATATEANSSTLNVQTLQVGSGSGDGVFAQSAGKNTAYGSLYLGLTAGSSGTYHLDGNGTLKDANAYVGYSGTGVFTQSDGNHSVTGSLYLGYNSSSSSGTYQLSGSGRQVAGSEYIGWAGTGLFQQSGGQNTSGYLGIGVKGRYTLTGGSLTVNGRLDSNGVLDMSTGSGVLSLSGPIKMKSTGRFDLAGGTLAHIDPNLYVSIQSDGNFHVFSGSHQIDSVLPWDPTILGGTTVVDAGASLILNKITQTALTVRGALSAGQLAVGMGSSSAGTFSIPDANASVTISSLLTIAAKGSFSAAAGSTIHMTGSTFQNQSTDANAMAGMANLKLIYESADANYDPFEVAGRDWGADANKFAKNFGLDALQLGGDGGPGRVILVDFVDNQPSWSGTEALYLHSLVVNPGSELCLSGLHLYVGGKLVNPGDGDLYGGGEIAASVPEPATLMLLAFGGAMLGLRKRRR